MPQERELNSAGCWIRTGAMPGTGCLPRVGQLIGRYFAYFAACIPFGPGIRVAFDKKKQGWRAKLAGTVVVRQARN